MTTYRESGVDLNAADELIERIRPAVTKTWNEDVVGGFGGFAAGVTIPSGYTNPVLMMSTDGVGTKAELARQAGLLDGLGWDLVAMCIDDLAAAGARPIAMTDYMAMGRINVTRVEQIVRSIADACTAAGVALLGGETAEHPRVMEANKFDLAGTALGILEGGREVDGSSIASGDVVIGIDSPNIRSNGFSLIRSVLEDAPGIHLPIKELLEPSVLYTPHIMRLLEQLPVNGLAHITGGGLPGNIARILPSECNAVIDPGSWCPPAAFSAISAAGNINQKEMFRTFNMGIGFIAIVRAEHADTAVAVLSVNARNAHPIGEITHGSGRVQLHDV